MFYHCLENLGGVQMWFESARAALFLSRNFKRASRSHAKTGFLDGTLADDGKHLPVLDVVWGSLRGRGCWIFLERTLAEDGKRLPVLDVV